MCFSICIFCIKFGRNVKIERNLLCYSLLIAKSLKMVQNFWMELCRFYAVTLFMLLPLNGIQCVCVSNDLEKLYEEKSEKLMLNSTYNTTPKENKFEQVMCVQRILWLSCSGFSNCRKLVPNSFANIEVCERVNAWESKVNSNAKNRY